MIVRQVFGFGQDLDGLKREREREREREDNRGRTMDSSELYAIGPIGLVSIGFQIPNPPLNLLTLGLGHMVSSGGQLV